MQTIRLNTVVQNPMASPFKAQTRSLISKTLEDTVHFGAATSKKSNWAKSLGVGLLGLMSLLPAGCTSNTQRMEEKYQQIPVVQVEKRLEFLKQQLSNEDAWVHAKAVEHIGELGITTKEKVSLLLDALGSRRYEVAIAAENALTKSILANVNEPEALKTPLSAAIQNRPWTEAYSEFSHFIMIPDGNNGFMYIPQYDTKYRDHGNADQYQQAVKQVQEWLNQ